MISATFPVQTATVIAVTVTLATGVPATILQHSPDQDAYYGLSDKIVSYDTPNAASNSVIENPRGELMTLIATLRALSDGWLGEGSLAPSQTQLDELWGVRRVLPADARISAAADGSVIIEWENLDHEHLVSIERNNTILHLEETAGGELVREDSQPYSEDGLVAFLGSGANG